MIRALAFVMIVALLQFAAFAQTPAGEAGEAAEAVAARAAGTFETIDPDSDGSADGDAAAVYSALPPLTGPAIAPAPAPAPTIAPAPVPIDEAVIAGDAAGAPRGAAVRMISEEVVQPLAVSAAPAAASRDPFVIKSILSVEGSIRYGDWFWDESAAPAAGKLVITVDLEARVISAFRDGHEIGTAVALLGTQAHPTPLGTFPILTKEKDNVSEKYNNAPMPFTLRLTWDGIAIHGSPVMNGYASHGCIGVPDEFAARLFAAAKRGDRVIITRGKMVGVGDKIL